MPFPTLNAKQMLDIFAQLFMSNKYWMFSIANRSFNLCN